MTPHLDSLAELTSILADPPGELAFRAAVSVLDTWTGPGQDAAVAHAATVLDTWPDECRAAPWTWVAAALGREPGVGWPLARSVRMTAKRIGCTRFRADQLASVGLTAALTSVTFDRYAWLDGANEAGTLTTAADRWPNLRHVARLRPTDDGVATAAFNTVRDPSAEGAPYAAESAIKAVVARSLRDAPAPSAGPAICRSTSPRPTCSGACSARPRRSGQPPSIRRASVQGSSPWLKRSTPTGRSTSCRG